jgi:hypothetical protein
MKEVKSAGMAWADVKAAKHAEWERSGLRDNGGRPKHGRGGKHTPKTAYKRKPKHGGWA